MRRRERWRGRRGEGSLWLYRLLLWLYPPSLRREYGDEMLWLFRRELRHEVMRHGPPGAARAWAMALRDLVVSLPREWPHELQRSARSERRQAGRAPHRPDMGAVEGQLAGLLGVQRHTVRAGSWGEREARRGMNDTFEKFTERARKVLHLAQEEAQRFKHTHVGTEHLLLGLVREGDGIAAKALISMGVELDKTRAAVEHIIGRGDRTVLGEIRLTPRSKKVIELAVDEARRLNHHYVGTEHLLLGLIREGEGIAAGVLESQGVRLEDARRVVLEMLGPRMGTDPGAAWHLGTMADAALLTLAPPQILDRLTPPGAQVLLSARDEAVRLNHNEVGTEHLLLGLLHDRNTVAVRILTSEGVTLEDARRKVAETLKPGKRPTRGAVGASARATRVMLLADEEAWARNKGIIEPEHLLLGLLRESAGLQEGALRMVGLDPEALSAKTLKWLEAARAQRKRGAWTQAHGTGPALSQITLSCRDVAATQAFYERHLGATVVFGGETVTLRLPGGGALLALRPAPEGGLPVGGMTGVELDVWSGDVDVLWRTLKDDDVAGLSEITAADMPERSRAFTVLDPDGRLVRVHQMGGA